MGRKVSGKSVAGRLTSLSNDLFIKGVLNKRTPVSELIEFCLDKYGPRLKDRNPAPALTEDGEYQGTDLDPFTLFWELSDKEAVIEIPKYKISGPLTLNPYETVVSGEHRHGQCFDLVSNAETHAFSLRINDANVVKKKPEGGEIGAYRSFWLVDHFGRLNERLGELVIFLPDDIETFLDEHGVWEDDGYPFIRFTDFTSPSRAMGFYGRPYIRQKALVERIRDEARNYRKVADILRSSGVVLPEDEERVAAERVGRQKSIKVPNLEARIRLPPFEGQYPLLGMAEPDRKTDDVEYLVEYGGMPGDIEERRKRLEELEPEEQQAVLRYAERHANKLSYSAGTRPRVLSRATELAFFSHGFDRERKPGNEREPVWNIPEWRRDYKEGPKKRIVWNALEFGPDLVLYYRIRESSERVKAEYRTPALEVVLID